MPTPLRRGGEVGSSFTLTQFCTCLLGILWVVSWWNWQDQTMRLRTVEKELGDLKAGLKAIEPYMSTDRTAITQVVATVDRQDEKIKYVVGLATEMNSVLQGLAKAQIELRVRVEEKLGPAERKR